MKTTIYNIALCLIILSFAACALSQSNFKVGKKYYDEGNFDQAIIELEKSSIHDTRINDRINSFEYLGDAYIRKGNLDRAVLSYKNAYQLLQKRIGEIIDSRKQLKRDQRDDSSLSNYNTQAKVKKLSDELSKISMRAEEVKVKMLHVK